MLVPRPVVAAVAAASAAALLPDAAAWYPVAVNAAGLVLFGGSLLTGTPLVERLARREEPDLPAAARPYCRYVTVVWALFFALSAATAARLSRSGGPAALLWTVVQPLLVVSLVAGERFVRPHVKRRLLAPATVLLLAACPAGAEPPADAAPPADEAGLFANVRARGGFSVPFRQTRTLAGFSAPFVSTGRLTYVPGEKIVWTTEAPVRSEVRVTPDGVDETGGGGGTRERRGAAARATADVLLAIYGGDEESIKKRFSTDYSVDRDTFRLALVPREGRLSSVLSSVVLRGRSLPREVTVTLPGGDSTLVILDTLR